jgi:hypothetical protein
MARTSQSREPDVGPQLNHRQVRMAADGETANSARQAQQRKSNRVRQGSPKRLWTYLQHLHLVISTYPRRRARASCRGSD